MDPLTNLHLSFWHKYPTGVRGCETPALGQWRRRCETPALGQRVRGAAKPPFLTAGVGVRTPSFCRWQISIRTNRALRPAAAKPTRGPDLGQKLPARLGAEMGAVGQAGEARLHICGNLGGQAVHRGIVDQQAF